MRRYRAADPSRLCDLLLEEMAGILDRHADRLAARAAETVAEVRREVDAMLMSAERSPDRFLGWKRRVRQARGAAAAEEMAGA